MFINMGLKYYLIEDKYSKTNYENSVYRYLKDYMDEQNMIGRLAQQISDEIDKEILKIMEKL